MAGIHSQQYRDVIDTLVWQCREGPGQVGPDRARAGVWNANATADWEDRQHDFNDLLALLDGQQRDVLAAMLAQQFEAGVHSTLVVLHEAQIEPFDDGYEGTPFHDFVGRLGGWRWPEQ